MIFFYGAGVDGGGGYGGYRMIPTDGRKHDPKKAIVTTYIRVYRRTTGRATRWCSTPISFVDQTWLARGGFFHSDQMHLVEKFTRQGNQISTKSPSRIPEVLAEPWVMTPRTMRPIPNPEAGLLPERGNCEVYETSNITSQIRH